MDLLDKFKSVGIEIRPPEENEKAKENVKKAQENVLLTGDQFNKTLVEQALIPQRYVNLEFDPDKLKAEVVKEWQKSKRFTVKNFSKYVNTLQGVLTGLRQGIIPDRSYLFGFTSETPLANIAFAVTAIKLMYAHRMNVVPYVGCSELSQIISLEEDRINSRQTLRALEYNIYTRAKEIQGLTQKEQNNEFVQMVANEVIKRVNSYDINNSDPMLQKGKNNEPNVMDVMIRKQPVFYRSLTDRFSWQEYVNADLLICWIGLGGQEAAESKALQAVMKARTAVGKPTICFMNSSLTKYTADENLYRMYWSELEDLDDGEPRLNRFTHIACYKQFSRLGNVMSGLDDKGDDA